MIVWLLDFNQDLLTNLGSYKTNYFKASFMIHETILLLTKEGNSNDLRGILTTLEGALFRIMIKSSEPVLGEYNG